MVVPASPVLPTLGLIGQWCCQKSTTLGKSACSPGEGNQNKNNKKSVTICTVTKDVETSRLSSNTRPHYITALVSKAYTTQRCCRDYSKETAISCQSSAARRNNGANRKTTTHLLWRHDNTVDALSSFLATTDLQNGGIFDLGELWSRLTSYSSFLPWLRLR